ncbi:uncharacterized protein LOC106504335 isoform X3 [Sus scrofa]|uniref:uncharacterized protein LOC106504335 isoform X3 n=1 Tax=Sus scrofa TaxID=9823 RepID=UPI000A2B6330|nr:uncharacterized protein LOC106504335 isoform X3 [Sus scrofa]
MAGSTVTPTQSDSRVLRSPLFRVRSRWAGGSGEVVFVRETRTHVGHVPGRDYSICSLAFTAEGVRSIKLGLTRHSAHLFLWDWKTIVHSSTAVNKIPDSRIIFLVSSFGGSPRIRSNTSVLTRMYLNLCKISSNRFIGCQLQVQLLEPPSGTGCPPPPEFIRRLP